MPNKKPGRLAVGVVGSGKVGPVLARALAGAGHEITAITASDDAARERVESMLPGVPVRPLDVVVRDSQLVLFAIPGHELPQLVAGLTTAKIWQPGQLLVHTAPEHGYSVFNPATAVGAIPLALHPALVFTGTSLDLARLSESTIAVTAPDIVLPIGQALAVEMGGEPVVISDADRPAYADMLDAAREMSAAIVKQTVSGLRELGAAMPERIVAGVANAAVAEALRVAEQYSAE
ncbi:NAD(P)-binding domain-containing protein [Canibacter zhoujuaniae]|uniref:NAD(P)-binding domain-containing protein n=1 Tax=Canibacter zhoujuaniae TaxID=2708343 RepID=UPI0014241FB0|nr:NAD(P)-binding domain-containing protein [Canibacter zhoujuaniae]